MMILSITKDMISCIVYKERVFVSGVSNCISDRLVYLMYKDTVQFTFIHSPPAL